MVETRAVAQAARVPVQAQEQVPVLALAALVRVPLVLLAVLLALMVASELLRAEDLGQLVGCAKAVQSRVLSNVQTLR